MKRILIISIIVVLGIVIYEGFVLFTPKKAKPEDPLKSLWVGAYAAEKNKWKQDIKDVGVEKAYEIFKKEVGERPLGIQHSLAHIFGELIYDSEGIGGIVYCDTSFSYGCYHSFSGKAIISEGLSAVRELDRLCKIYWKSDATRCLHGIGHGILGYVGYGNLAKALTICETMIDSREFNGCAGGVFMEYNFHTMESISGNDIRKSAGESLMEPCASVKTIFKPDCYFNQMQWWVSHFKNVYTEPVKLCESSEKEYIPYCIKGFADLVVARTWDVAVVKKACENFTDAQYQLSCKNHGYTLLFRKPEVKETAYKMCEGLSGADKTMCLTIK